MESHAFDMKSGVDVEHFTGHRRRIVAGQQERRSPDLTRIDESPQGRAARGLVEDLVEMLDA